MITSPTIKMRVILFFISKSKRSNLSYG